MKEKIDIPLEIINKYPPFLGNPELEAVFTHWVQSPEICPPLMPQELYNDCRAYYGFDTSNNDFSLAVEEERKRYQLSFDFIRKNIPFPPPVKPKFTFIDLFAGIGGFRLAMQKNGGKCLFSSEWDNHAKKTYKANFGEVPFGDIRDIDEKSIPDHDVLCAGFPCQPFSLAGVSARNAINLKHGFSCKTQGTLFFDIARIVAEKRPKMLLLENVKNLIRHDKGKTFKIIEHTIKELGYSFDYTLINASSLVPQRRIRCYMVCVRDEEASFEFPAINGNEIPLKTILEKTVDKQYTISDKLWAGHQRRTANNLARGTGFTAFCANIEKPSNTIVARYGKDGKECLVPQKNKNPRMLTPRECARLQGFPENFIIPVAKTAAYRQFGNSVAVPVVIKIGEKVLDTLEHIFSGTSKGVTL